MDKVATEDLYGLIMMGGKSIRMGFDKSVIPYHGKPQCQYLFELVSDLLPQTFVSVRKDQEVGFTDKVIADEFTAKGPLNGLLSAHRAFPDKAWLVLAVDLPFMTVQTICQLIESRKTAEFAIALAETENNLPEPLAAIWEPDALAFLLDDHMKGMETYPRKFLIDHAVRTVSPMREVELFNANDPTDFEMAMTVIEKLNGNDES